MPVLNTLELWADALKDSTIGINVQLPKVPMPQGDSRPPKVKRVMVITRDDEILDEQLGSTWPVLIVDQDTGAGFEALGTGQSTGSSILDSGTVSVSTIYATGNPDEAEAVRHGLHTMRACVLVLRELMKRDLIDSLRTRNEVQVMDLVAGPAALSFGTWVQRLDVGMITAALLTTFQVRDFLRSD